METNLETLPIGDNAPRLVNAVIEVPAGSRNKYEYEPELGAIMRDRVLPGAVRYPTDYGFIPSTMTHRGDALDIVVAAYDPAFPGCVVRARPIGALHITDSKGEEHNVFAVPDDDPRFADIHGLEELCTKSPSTTRLFEAGLFTTTTSSGTSRIFVQGRLEDLPDQNLREVEQFFEVYKSLEGDQEVEIRGWLSLEETHEAIREAISKAAGQDGQARA